MTALPPSLRAVVPASTSNLGPGFDALGLALALELRVTLSFERGAGATRVEAVACCPLRVA